MNTHRKLLSLVFAGLMAAGAAHAQSASASGDSVDLPGAGEASTRSHGVPNMHTTNPPVMQQLDVTGMIGSPPRILPNASADEAVAAKTREEVRGEIGNRIARSGTDTRVMGNRR